MSSKERLAEPLVKSGGCGAYIFFNRTFPQNSRFPGTSVALCIVTPKIRTGRGNPFKEKKNQNMFASGPAATSFSFQRHELVIAN
jgi:hypothetical protein